MQQVAENYSSSSITGVTEAIIIAGGAGTRLLPVIQHLPKCLAPVNHQPFLQYLLGYLEKQGIQHCILALGYLHHLVQEYIANSKFKMRFSFSIEESPLGTGGALKQALKKANTEQVLVVNGDTLFFVNTSLLLQQHNCHKAHCTVALKPMLQTSRYGVVSMNDKNIITNFSEKKYYTNALINGGVYLIEKSSWQHLVLPTAFSFEKDYLEKHLYNNTIAGYIEDAYFIDIGIPEDLERAQNDFKNM